MLDLWAETRSLLTRLDAEEVPYALAGAVAMAVHGVVRATADIDVLILPGDIERTRTLAAELGFTEESLPMRFADGTEVVRLVKLAAADALTLDLIPVGSHLEAVWDDRLLVESSEGNVWVISRDGLIRMKTAAGRDQDLADLRRLKELDG